ncbi:hypothetical protein BHM03_00053155, partial [Ensete ventricosum]
MGRLGGASSLSWKTRRLLVPELEDEVTPRPHPHTGRRGDTSPSSSHGKTRLRLALVLAQEDE